jgi:hypothetical protein
VTYWSRSEKIEKMRKMREWSREKMSRAGEEENAGSSRSNEE